MQVFLVKLYCPFKRQGGVSCQVYVSAAGNEIKSVSISI